MNFKQEVQIKLEVHLERLKLLEEQNKELLEAVSTVPNVKESAVETFNTVVRDYYFLWQCPDSQKTKQERKHRLHKIIDEIKERFSKIENRLDEVESSLSQFDNLKWRIVMLEEKLAKKK
jgi:DNA repair exonuclease SbcCD ATPase subunit